MIEGYLTTKEVAEKFGVTVGRIQQLVAEKRLSAVKIGQTNLITEKEIESFDRQSVGRPKKNGSEAKER
ncbi:hypothetical protein BH18ACI1_BH18ACI1_17530 [soil metagenome]